MRVTFPEKHHLLHINYAVGSLDLCQTADEKMTDALKS